MTPPVQGLSILLKKDFVGYEPVYNEQKIKIMLTNGELKCPDCQDKIEPDSNYVRCEAEECGMFLHKECAYKTDEKKSRLLCESCGNKENYKECGKCKLVSKNLVRCCEATDNERCHVGFHKKCGVLVDAGIPGLNYYPDKKKAAMICHPCSKHMCLRKCFGCKVTGLEANLLACNGCGSMIHKKCCKTDKEGLHGCSSCKAAECVICQGFDIYSKDNHCAKCSGAVHPGCSNHKDMEVGEAKEQLLCLKCCGDVSQRVCMVCAVKGKNESGCEVDKLCRCKLWMHPSCAVPLPESDIPAVCPKCLEKEKDRLEKIRMNTGPVLIPGDENNPQFQAPGEDWAFQKKRFIETIYNIVGVLDRCYKVPIVRFSNEVMNCDIDHSNTETTTFVECNLVCAISEAIGFHCPKTMGTTPLHFQRSMKTWQDRGIWGFNGGLPYALLRLHSVLTLESFGKGWERDILDWCLDTSIENFSSECKHDLETTWKKIKMIDLSAFNEQS